eukprot:CAMPEP_0117758510 /NCGR_PEP_ID=MMETSP0947-20121206/15426_1 /TAXON_ID=44440 /ORGANISM="Chattonella subsalsa, Strain CCMP2191" /LENGTH=95 /DNA_ID=CAMNT_0005578721 /DNA_START=294 /DNA_END=581 /DNA_ORIENTATION=-
MNLLCNTVIKTILNGSEEDVFILKEKVRKSQDTYVVPGDSQSALFFDSIIFILSHDLHPGAGDLKGRYATAYKTIIKFIEDAGWKLTDPPFRVTG